MAVQVQAAVRAAFVRFREAHDVEALAFVFDRVAQGLLLVAGHLAGPGVDAEDLVQTTFVQAMRNAHAYDASQPLEPWLLGILGNEAHAARRRARRVIDGSRLPPPAVDDPGVRAQQRECVQQLQQAIESLPERHREVVALYWVHGMTPAEIAHALGRPVGSVKSWLHRSLARLRRTVPSALGVAPRLALPEGKRWALLREAVLTAARGPDGAAGTFAATTVAAASAAEGVAVPRALRHARAALLAVAGAAVGLAAWVLDAAGAGLSERAALPPVTATTEPVDARGVDEPVLAAGESPARATAPVASRGTSELVVGVRWHDGAAAAVRGDVEPCHACDPRLQRVEFTTDPHGLARVRGLAPGAVRVRLDRGSERTVVLQPGANVVDLVVARGVSLRGRVRNDRGEPFAGADVWLARDAIRDDGAFVARSGADGAFVLRDVPLGAGIAAFADGFVPTRAITVRAGRDGEAAPITLDFERTAGEVTIVVTGPDGAPVGAAWVQVGGSDVPFAGDVAGGGRAPPADDCRPPPPWLGRTDDDGRAHCRQMPQRQGVPVFARAREHAGACRWLRLDSEPGAVILRLPPAGTVVGTVRHDAAPAADALVRAVVDVPLMSPARRAPRWFHPQVQAAPDGGWTLTGVAFGATALEARDGVWFAATERHVGAADVDRWHTVLTRGGRVAGVARCADGTSLAGYRLSLHAHGVTHDAEVAGDGTFAIEHLGELEFEAVLHEAPNLGDAVLLRRRGVRIGDAPDLVVPASAAPTASVRGRLLGAAGEPLGGGLLDDVQRPLGGRDIACRPDGGFAMERLPPGDYQLLGGAPYALHRAFTLRHGEALDLGTLRAAAPASCVVAVASDRPRAGLEVRLLLRSNPSTMVNVARWLGPHEDVAMAAPAGDYLLCLFDDGVSVHQQVVALAAGTVTYVRTPPAPELRVVLELHLPATSPWTMVQWRCAGLDYERVGHTPLRPFGVSRTPRLAVALPTGSCRFAAVADSGERVDVPLTLVDGGTSDPIRVELR